MDAKKIKLDTLLLTTLVFLATVMFDRYLHSFYLSINIPRYAGLGITRVLGISAILLLLVRFQKTFVTTELSKPRFLNGIKKGLFWSAGFGVIALTGFAVLYMVGINPFKLFHTRLPEHLIELIFLFITGGIIAPIAEELFFRGILFGYLRQWGVIIAVVASTTIFVLFHLLGTGIFVPQIVGGLVFAISYEIEKSLLVPIIIHSTGNIALFTLSLI